MQYHFLTFYEKYWDTEGKPKGLSLVGWLECSILRYKSTKKF